MDNILKKIPVILFFVLTFSILIIDHTNFLVVFIFCIITALPVIFGLWKSKKLFLLKKDKRVLELYYFSISFIYVGYLFALSFRSDDKLLLNPYTFWAVLIIYLVVLLGIAVYWGISNHSLGVRFGNILMKRDSIPIQEFIEEAIKQDVNVLAVAGNLNALSDIQGITFLKYFLNAHKKNKLHLFIPTNVKDSLKKIKNKLSDNELAKRIIIFDVEPFVFLQGIVFAGDIREVEDKMDIIPKGYYLYKPIVSTSDPFPNDGLFVDVSKVEATNDISISIEAYYRHLRNCVIKANGYRYKADIRKIGEKSSHKYISDPYDLSTIS